MKRFLPFAVVGLALVLGSAGALAASRSSEHPSLVPAAASPAAPTANEQAGQTGDQGEKQDNQTGDQGQKEENQTGAQGEKQDGEQGEKQNGQVGENPPPGAAPTK